MLLLEEMQEEKLRANTIVYNSVLKACGEQWQAANLHVFSFSSFFLDVGCFVRGIVKMFGCCFFCCGIFTAKNESATDFSHITSAVPEASVLRRIPRWLLS